MLELESLTGKSSLRRLFSFLILAYTIETDGSAIDENISLEPSVLLCGCCYDMQEISL